jgi:patatin-related protein
MRGDSESDVQAFRQRAGSHGRGDGRFQMNPGIGNAVNVKHPLDNRELRFAVTMNGGVSLAVYMGGVSHELNELTDAKGPYRRLLKLLSAQAPTIDVLTGTSAGGINAAALALAQSNENRTDLSALKRLWIQHGQIGSLLRQPFRKGLSSILQGDDYFLPQIERAFKGLTAEHKRSARPIDLTITTTLLNPVNEYTVDDLGTGIVQTQHAGRFWFVGDLPEDDAWKLLGDQKEPRDVFTGGGEHKRSIRDQTVRALALATRASASFPVAFEPSFIPIGEGSEAKDMADFASWTPDAKDCKAAAPDDDGAKDSKTVLSRFTVDGGVLANTPTKPALDAIRRRAAGDRLVRRVLVLVHPHALPADAVRSTTDDRRDPPSLLGTLSGVLKASSSVGSRSYVEEIQRHNDLAYRWRDGREITLSKFKTREQLQRYLTNEEVGDEEPGQGDPTTSWELFHSLRKRRGAFVLADQIRKHCHTPFGELIRIAREEVEVYTTAQPGGGSKSRPLPFIPDRPPCAQNLREGTWPWGLDMAVGLATSVTELLRELLNAPELDSGHSHSAPVGNLAGLSSQTTRAWRDAVNARIALELLGKQEEERAKKDVDERPARKWLADNLAHYAKRMRPDDPKSDATRIRSIIETNVITPLLVVIEMINTLKETPNVTLPDVPLTEPNPLLEATGAADLLKMLMEVEVIGYLVTEHDGAGDGIPSAPIELVQISAQVHQHFAKGFTPDDKLAGMSLSRFGAFLKRSWRANDWIWGRFDAIKVLLLILLSAKVVKALKATFPPETTSEDLVDEMCLATFLVPRLGPADADEERTDQAKGAAKAAIRRLFGSETALRELRTGAIAEVKGLFNEDDIGKPLEKLASLLAYGYQMSAAAEEVPWLAESVYDDQEDGAAGFKSSAFLARYTKLSDQFLGDQHDAEHQVDEEYKLLRLFVDAGLGQEAVGDELPSDMMVRTAATTAAVAATMISDPASGLSFAAPVTKIVRGVVGAPYWIITGLTQRGNAARVLAASALALGIALMALALLASLGGLMSTLVPTIGAGSLITVFAYAAARSRSVVHGAALLGLLIPLAAFAAHRLSGNVEEASGVFQFSFLESAFATVCVIALIVGTVVIANINAPTVPPLAVVGRWFSWFRTRGKSTRDERRPRPKLKVRARQFSMYVRRGVLIGLGVVLLGWALMVLLDQQHWLVPLVEAQKWLPNDVPYASVLIVAAPMVVIIGIGVVAGWRRANKLRPYDHDRRDPDTLHRAGLTDPAGIAIAWSVVYGFLYVSLAGAIYFAHRGDMQWWAGTAAAMSLVLGWMFSVVFVYLIFWRRERRLVRRLAAAFASARTAPPTELKSKAALDETLRLLKKVGEESTYLIKKDGNSLTWRGLEVAARALAKARVLRMSGRNSRPVALSGTTSAPTSQAAAQSDQST